MKNLTNKLDLPEPQKPGKKQDGEDTQKLFELCKAIHGDSWITREAIIEVCKCHHLFEYDFQRKPQSGLTRFGKRLSKMIGKEYCGIQLQVSNSELRRNRSQQFLFKGPVSPRIAFTQQLIREAHQKEQEAHLKSEQDKVRDFLSKEGF